MYNTCTHKYTGMHIFTGKHAHMHYVCTHIRNKLLDPVYSFDKGLHCHTDRNSSNSADVAGNTMQDPSINKCLTDSP